MATTNFYLRAPKADGFCKVDMVHQHRGKKLRITTDISVLRKDWTGKRIKGKTLEVLTNNKTLDDMEGLINDIKMEALQIGISFTMEQIKQKFNAGLKEIKLKKYKPGYIQKQQTEDFFELFDRFIQKSKTTLANATIKEYISTRSRLKAFEKWLGEEIEFSSINMQFYEKLLSYLINELGLLNNSVGKHVKCLKSFINYLKTHDLIQTQVNLTGFKKLKEDIDIVALTTDELMTLHNFNELPRHLQHVKDLFCLECFTGLRFSDIGRIRNENLKTDHLEFRTLKTKDSLIVPLNVFAKEIIERYRGQFPDRPVPPAFTNQKTNVYIKEVAKLAGITMSTMIEKFSGSKRIEIRKPKCELISTHTGRRTFITLSHEKGMQPEMIMKITGIKNWDTLKKYLKISEKSKLQKMNEFWNKETLKVV